MIRMTAGEDVWLQADVEPELQFRRSTCGPALPRRRWKEVIVDRDGGRPVIEKAGHGHAEIRCRLDREDERPLTYGRAISRAVRPTVTSRRVSPPPGGPPQDRRGPRTAAPGARE